jgi:hypothetical protein
MFYPLLTVDLLLLVLGTIFAVRLVRATPEMRKEMVRLKKSTVILFAGVVVVALIAVSVLVLSSFGLTGIRAVAASKSYLRDKYGVRDSWNIRLAEHIERTKKPEAGVYQISYEYGEKKGQLVVEYYERNGKLAFEVRSQE